MPAPALVDNEQDTDTTAGTSQSWSFNNTYSEDDFVLVALSHTNTGGSRSAVNVPSGWTELYDADIGGASAVRAVLWWRIAPAGGLSSISWTTSESVGWAGNLIAFSGADTADPIDASGTLNLETSSAPTANSITTNVADTRLITIAWADDNDLLSEPGGTWTNGPGTAETSTPGNGCGVTLAHKTQASAGSTGSADFSLIASEENAAVIIAIKEPGGAGGANPKGPLGMPLHGPFGGPV